MQPWHHKVRPYVRLLERECYHMIDPDEVTPPEAKERIVKHVRIRLKEFLGRKRVSMEAVAWFLAADIPTSEWRYVAYKLRPCGTWTKKKDRRQGVRAKMRGWR